MPNKNYERGRAAEYRACDELRKQGYTAVRTAGSHGVADVIAWQGWIVRFIQIKTFKDTEDTYAKDVECLRMLPLPPSSRAELWSRKHGQKGWHRQEIISTSFGQPSWSQPTPQSEHGHYSTADEET